MKRNAEKKLSKVKLTYKNGEVITAKGKSVIVFYEGDDGMIRCFGEQQDGFLKELHENDCLGQLLKEKKESLFVSSTGYRANSKKDDFNDPNQAKLEL